MKQTEYIDDQIRRIIFQKSKSNNLMSKQPEGEQMFEIGQQKPGQIGTEIFDPTMPSDLDFDNKKQQEYEGKQINESSGLKQEKGKTKLVFDEDIKSYKIKGKINFTDQPKYKCASYLKGHVDTFEVKAYDEQKSGGMKSIWESLVGYVKREICIQGGYIYIFEKTKQGYLTHAALKLVDLFKIFVDHEQSKIRFVFHIDKEHLTNKNFQVKSCQDLIQKIMQQSSKIGLMTISQ